jgi:hypothetical protein
MGDPIDATKVLLDFFLGGVDEEEAEPTGPAEPQPVAARQMTLHFKAKVVKIVVLGDAAGTVIPVHPDPRWAMSVRILSVEEHGSPLASSGLTIFGIHSPTKLFASSAGKATGRTYEFEILAEETEPGTWSYGVLGVAKIP